ncbi:MAG: ATPase domain-containing protein, partial [Patescibacteria group bacterium]|nr:ATPase domain-containing protein [Patescibacteria group bacterium]
LKTLYEESKINKKNTLFISLDQEYYSLYNQMISLEFPMNEINITYIDKLDQFGTLMTKVKANNNGNMIFIDFRTMEQEIKKSTGENKAWLNIIKNVIKKIKQSVDLDIISLDSLEMLSNLSCFEKPKQTIQELFYLLKDLHITSFLLSERKNDSISPIFDENIYCDSIIHLSLEFYRRKAVRELTILKMRQSKCVHDSHTLRFDKGKFLIEHGGENPLI